MENGVDTIGLYDPANAAFFLRNSNRVGGRHNFHVRPAGLGWKPIVGDWNGDASIQWDCTILRTVRSSCEIRTLVA